LYYNITSNSTSHNTSYS